MPSGGGSLTGWTRHLQVLLDEVGEQPLQEGLGNTADRVRKLDKEKEQDQARLWEWRDTLQDIWKDPAIVVSSHVTRISSHNLSQRRHPVPSLPAGNLQPEK